MSPASTNAGIPIELRITFAGFPTGFSDKVLANLYAKFQKLRVPSCPFINLPEKSKGRWGLGITPTVMKRCEWVQSCAGRPGQIYRVDIG